jgi:hypothetical protein
MIHPSTHWPELDWKQVGTNHYGASVIDHPFCVLYVRVWEARDGYVVETSGACIKTYRAATEGDALRQCRDDVHALIRQLAATVAR